MERNSPGLRRSTGKGGKRGINEDTKAFVEASLDSQALASLPKPKLTMRDYDTFRKEVHQHGKSNQAAVEGLIKSLGGNPRRPEKDGLHGDGHLRSHKHGVSDADSSTQALARKLLTEGGVQMAGAEIPNGTAVAAPRFRGGNERTREIR